MLFFSYKIKEYANLCQIIVLKHIFYFNANYGRIDYLMYSNVVILSTGVCCPKDNVMDYNEIVTHFKSIDIDVEGLLKHLGKKKRYIADSYETPLTIGQKAAVKALEAANLCIKDIDMIVVSTDTPEYIVPSNAIKLANLLDAKNVNVLYDLNGNCAGGVIAMDQVSGFLKSHKHIKRALVVSVFMGSYIHNETEALSYSIFSDAAGAVILEKKEESFERGFIDSEYDANCEYHNMNSFPQNGFNDILKKNLKDDQLLKLFVNSEVQLSFVPDVWEGIIRTLLGRNLLTPKDIDNYIFSQFSLFDINSTVTKLKIDNEKYTYVGDEYGYTGSSSPILALDKALKNNMIKKDSYIIFCGIGSGYTSISVLYKY